MTVVASPGPNRRTESSLRTASDRVSEKRTRTAAPPGRQLQTSRPLLLPLLFTVLLACFALLPTIQQNRHLLFSVLGAAGALVAGLLLLWRTTAHRNLRIEVSLRAQHYLQASMHATILAYWGWYWRPVYDSVPLIAAQLAFAYAFDAMLAWSRRDTYTLGFGPFPVIFSTNLFLWFKPDWFYLQFCMVALGFAAKELIRWDKAGRPAHIFNPSSFMLSVFSIGLILTGTSSWTFGEDIARTQFNPPNIYLLLFLVGLPGQLLFGVATMTMSAVVTTYLFGLAYFGATGTYYFIDSYIPVAVFLGMHLLFTDPSTSPRTELGRIMFGMLYAAGVISLYAVLRAAGLPAFYDKLLPVPILNLSIKVIDRAAQSAWLSRLSPARLAASLSPRRRNVAYVLVWTVTFIVLSRVDGVGDHHPGHHVTFWQQACDANKSNACETLAVILDTYCRDGSPWACNEVGVLRWHHRVGRADAVLSDFSRACSLGSAISCGNLTLLQQNPSMPPRQTAPALGDFPVILRTGKGAIPERTPVQIFDRACNEGWLNACHSLAAVYLQPQGVSRDPLRARDALEKACGGRVASACVDLALMHYSGDGIPIDRTRAMALLQSACDLGERFACTQRERIIADESARASAPQ